MADAKKEAQLEELRIKRSSMKGQVTRFTNYLDAIDDNEVLSSVKCNDLTLRLNKLIELSTRFDELQTLIEVSNGNELDSELAERQTFEDKINIAIATAQSILEKVQDSKESKASSLQTCSSHYHSEPLGFRLPQIKISKFDGSYYKWMEFRDLYESLIHNNDKIPAIHKFHYLTSYLEGEAARVISNLGVSDANYTEAWKLLCGRFNNKRQLITNHLNSLFNIDSLQRESDKSLRFLSDHVTKNLRALKTLGQPTEHWDTMLVHLLSAKLDSNSNTKWEEYRNALSEWPTLNDFQDFLKIRADILENLHRSRKDRQTVNKPEFTVNKPSFKHDKNIKTFVVSDKLSDNKGRPCVMCRADHRVYDCPAFRQMSVDERWSRVSGLQLCHVCLRPDHETRRCKLSGCRVCKRRHNTYLHTTQTNSPNLSSSGASMDESVQPPNMGKVEPVSSSTMMASDGAEVPHTSTANSSLSSSEVLLSTALIEVVNPCKNRKETIKCLLDCGSQSSYMTEGLRERLEIPSQSLIATKILGIGNTPLNCQPGRCRAQIKSKLSEFDANIDFLVLNQITDHLPKRYFDISHLNIPASIRLADPTFNVPSNIDILLGADIFWHIVGGDNRSLNSNKQIRLIESKLGWLLSGSMTSAAVHVNSVTTRSNLSLSDLSDQMTRFWETEELPQDMGSRDVFEPHPIEKHFVENTQRQPDGRFVVRLPLNDTPDCLGNTFNIAKRRLFNLEKRFSKQPELKSMYTDFIDEYRDLGHLTESNFPYRANFLPHHAVMKEDSESSRLRTVFDASCLSSSGYSINDIQMVGPNIQDSLFNILLRFRHYKYVLSGDIEKQYRQIVMNEADRYLQVILWREDEHLPVRSLTLNTVTYGFASASFLAARCLWQLGAECNDPAVKTIIQNDFYCDDLLTGADSETELLHIQAEVSRALASGCFNLRKYRSNSNELLNSASVNSQNNLALSQACQTLGLGWNPSQDLLNFSISADDTVKRATKRSILSKTFQVFDPLGLLSLCTVKPKILMQKLWIAKAGWDEPAPPEIQRSWSRFVNNLHHLKGLKIPRYVLSDSPSTIEIHCFSDASQQAVSACIYVKSISSSGAQRVSLLCAKNRLAPIKLSTIPRLELAGALLAAKTYDSVARALRKPISRTVFWTDSTVVLAWLKTDISKLKTFVANRVAAIAELTPAGAWRHVPTSQNPADLATRGVDPQHVSSASLWWQGPEFLLEPECNWPILDSMVTPETLPEVKLTSMVTNVEPDARVIDFNRFSKFITLQRTVAFVKRFINNCRPSLPKLTGTLNSQELTEALHTLVKLSQQQLFSEEIEILQKNKALGSKSHLASLTPFLDSQGILRVGGRLDASDYSYDKKHPMLLRAKHQLTKLIFRHEHLRLLHAGPQLLLSSVRDIIWPVGGRNLARSTARNCVTCSRAAGRTLKNIMGNLPAQRVKVDFPFAATALDMGGPYLITDRRGRGCKVTKCYLCLFICLRYKCVHLEAVSELSKDAFILALRRFIARRSKPAEIFCDNGRNFVSGAKEINEFVELNKNDISEFAADQNIRFAFSPAYAPNFNGYVEAGIKNAKFHLKRILGTTHLTFEELSTLFSQIEAILNSRPLCPLSTSPTDYSPLTPGHFLVGRPLTSIPSPPLQDHNPNRLDRYRRLEQLRQHFWSRWSTEYVSELQQRYKWRERKRDLRLGELVLIKDEGLPPLLWRMGRVSKLYYGKDDGVPRVADIATSRGLIKRALNRICPLPIEEDS